MTIQELDSLPIIKGKVQIGCPSCKEKRWVQKQNIKNKLMYGGKRDFPCAKHSRVRGSMVI